MKLSLYPPLAALAALGVGAGLRFGLGDALMIVGVLVLGAWVGYFALHVKAAS